MAIALQIERNRGEKGGFMSLQSMGSGRMDTGFGSDTNLSSLGGSGSGFGASIDVDSFSTKSKGLYLLYLINMLCVFSSNTLSRVAHYEVLHIFPHGFLYSLRKECGALSTLISIRSLYIGRKVIRIILGRTTVVKGGA